jgi:(p)ppGpp synthase/HD superfamily hydrolase
MVNKKYKPLIAKQSLKEIFKQAANDGGFIFESDKAAFIMVSAFAHRTDKSGKPYSSHCRRVAEETSKSIAMMPYSDERKDCIKAAALLHDLIEDTDWSFNDLKSVRFSELTIGLIRSVTQKETVKYGKEPYFNFIENCSKNRDAILIKIADLQDNGSLSRIPRQSINNDKTYDRLQKYSYSLEYLKAVLERKIKAGMPMADFFALRGYTDETQQRLLKKFSKPKTDSQAQSAPQREIS